MDALSRHVPLVKALREAVFRSPGECAPDLRQAAGNGAVLPEPWAVYAEKVREHSYRITDADVAGLKGAGCTEEQIFEITIAAATGAALRRLDAGLAAVRGVRP
jgi:hypothetical protein